MRLSSLFNSTFKCYKVSTTTAKRSDVKTLMNDQFKRDLKELVIESIYKDIQSKKHNERFMSDLLDDSEQYELTELRNLIRIGHSVDSVEIDSTHYSINYLSIRSNDSNIFKPQLFIFITDDNSVKNYNTILMVRSIPRLNNVVLRHLINGAGVLANQLKIPSDMLKSCLDHNIDEIIKYKSWLELTFGNFNTKDSSLSSITINLEHEDLKRLNDIGTDFTIELFKHLKANTAINFDKIELTKVSCNIFYLNYDGRLKFIDDYNMGQKTENPKLAWFIIQRLF